MLKKVHLFAFTVIIALVVSAASLAAVKTTGPGSRVDVFINIKDKSYIVELQTQSDYRGGQEMYLTDPSEVMRGEVARFDLWNLGNQPRTFSVFGKTTPTIKAGGKATILVPLVKRGQFPYTIKGGKGTKTLKGVFTVN
jgi:hypothetical protein